MRIFAHRGASAQAPENTLAAFELALTQGAWWLELDVQCLEDELVVLHDDTLDRTTDGEGPLAALTLAQLRALDAGQGERVPLLRELLERLAGRAALNVELKGPGTGAPAARLLAQQVAQGRWAADAILLSAFSATELEAARAVAPGLPRALLSARADAGAVAAAAALGAVALHVPVRAVDAAAVGRVHGAGLALNVFTVNDAQSFARLRALGVDGLFTDYPGQALRHWRHA